MQSWNSYPKIYSITHTAARELLEVPCYFEEKVDGSQFSFGVDEVGQTYLRSRGMEMEVYAPTDMFKLAAETVKSLRDKLHPGWTYRAEFLAKPKHNSLAYASVPAGHLILFDINTGNEEWMSPALMHLEGDRIGLNVVPVLGSTHGPVKLEELIASLDTILESESVLGGQKIEGVVMKPYPAIYGPDKKRLIAKYVSPAFKEVHAREWKQTNPTSGDVLTALGRAYGTEARWLKAVQHLEESGRLVNAVQDIGPLIHEIVADVHTEEEASIKEDLFKWAWPHIKRQITVGVPQWYKERLVNGSNSAV